MQTDEAIPVVQLDRVSKRFGAASAVREVDLRIDQGEFFSLLGPSGCGKTTTLRMIAGFETPTSGRVLLEGRDVSLVPAYKRNVNLVFQNYALFPHMSVFENIAFGPRNKGLKAAQIRERVDEILRVVRLEAFGARKPAQLSGGQQQRVALARALVNQPAALLLDEPLGALDLKLRHAMQRELKAIQRDLGIAFVYVTHDQEEALTMSDRIAVMNEGRVEQLGTPEDIYDRPVTTFVASFIGLANLLPCTIEDVAGDRVHVRFATGGVSSVMSNGRAFRPGDAATLVLRPERLRVSATPPGDAGALKARAAAVVFQGPVTRIDLLTGDGAPLTVVLPAEMRAGVPAADQDVWVSWEPGSASLVANAPAATLGA